MPAYPSFAQLEDSAEELLDGRQVVRASNGAPRLRELYPADKRAWTVVHLLNDTDRGTLETFIGTYRGGTFDFTWAGAIYTASFGAPARQYEWTQFGWRTTVRLVQA